LLFPAEIESLQKLSLHFTPRLKVTKLLKLSMRRHDIQLNNT
jgi:hypothetical protein